MRFFERDFPPAWRQYYDKTRDSSSTWTQLVKDVVTLGSSDSQDPPMGMDLCKFQDNNCILNKIMWVVHDYQTMITRDLKK